MDGIDEVDCVRCGGGGCGGSWIGLARGGDTPFVCGLAMAAASIDWERFSCLMKGGGWALALFQCLASIEELSSIGVKML